MLDSSLFLQCFEKIAITGWKGYTAEKIATLLDITPDAVPKKEEVLREFHQHITQALEKELDREEMKDVSFKEQVQEIILCRLELLAPYKSTLKKIWEEIKRDPTLLPSFFCQGEFSLHWLKSLNDEMPALKTSLVSPLLGILYSVVLIYWLKDESHDLSKTMAFLDRIFSWAIRIYPL